MRWTRHVDLFDHDILVLPVNENKHWALGVVGLRWQIAKYYDSLGATTHRVMDALMEHLNYECMARKGEVLDAFQTVEVPDVPMQKNGSDCGVFALQFAERLSRDASVGDLRQRDMSKYRLRMIYEVATGKLAR
jgi:Ulp1 family protease